MRVTFEIMFSAGPVRLEQEMKPEHVALLTDRSMFVLTNAAHATAQRLNGKMMIINGAPAFGLYGVNNGQAHLDRAIIRCSVADYNVLEM